jgi:hypothetical protein
MAMDLHLLTSEKLYSNIINNYHFDMEGYDETHKNREVASIKNPN